MISFTPDTLDGAGNVQVDLTYDNSGNLFSYGIVYISAPNKRLWQTQYFGSDSLAQNKSSFEVTIDKYAIPGTYKIDSIYLPLSDAQYTFKYTNASFFVKNTVADTVGPLVSNFKVSKEAAVPGDTVLISFNVSDTISGISGFIFSISDANNRIYLEKYSNYNLNNKMAVSYNYIVGKFETSGPRDVSINLYDFAGNNVSYNSADLNFNLTVSGTTPDTIAPVFKSAKSIQKNDSLYLEITLKDDFSGINGIDYGSIYFSRYSLNYYFSKTKALDSVCEINLTAINQFMPTGAYDMSLSFSDNAGNSTYYDGVVIIANKNSDNEPPKLVRVNFDKDTVFGDGVVDLIIRATDNKSGIQYISGTIQDSISGRGMSFTTYFDSVGVRDTTLIKRFNLSEFGPSGKWILADIATKDFAGLDNFMSNNLPDFIYYPKYLDIVPPIFEGITFDPKNVNAGDTVKVKIKAKDNFSGIGLINYDDELITNNNDISLNNWENIGNDTLQYKIPISKYAKPGPVNYTLYSIDDIAGNTNNINKNGTAYTIINKGKFDIAPPVFDSLIISPILAGKEDTIFLKFYVHDDLSGISLVSSFFLTGEIFDYLKPSGLLLLPEYLNDKEYVCKFAPGTILPGKYNFYSLSLQDSALNVKDSTYSDTGYYFVVKGDIKIDNTAPALLETTINPDTVKPGEKISIEFKVLEKESPIIYLFATISDPTGTENFVLQLKDWDIIKNQDTFICKANFVIPNDAKNGKWEIKEIGIYDLYFNITDLAYNTDYTSGSFEVVDGQQIPNRPPTWIIQNINLTVDAEKSLKYTIPNYIISDFDGNPLSFSAIMGDGSKLPLWIDFSSDKLSLTFNPANVNKGESTIYIFATDPNGLKDSLEVNVLVNEVNHIKVSSVQGGEIKIYPNPVTEIITLKSPYLIKSIELYDLNGRVVFKQIGNNNVINVSGLNKGIYILKAETDKRTIIDKVIKN
jgi:hypothetical protein